MSLSVLGVLFSLVIRSATTENSATAAFTNATSAPGTVISAFCDAIGDFEPCTNQSHFLCKNGKCYCRDGNPFCRCNNYINEWFIGRNCDEKWTVVKFALVASLPGLALALIVGVTVYCIRSSGKTKNEQSPDKESSVKEINTEDRPGRLGSEYSNPVFTSDWNAYCKPEVPPSRSKERISSANAEFRPFSYTAHQPYQPYNNLHEKIIPNPYDSQMKYDGYGRSTQQNTMRDFSQASFSTPSYSAPGYTSQLKSAHSQFGRHY